MPGKNKNLIREWHEKFMKESMEQIDELIRAGLHEPIAEKAPATYGDAYKKPPEAEAPPVAPPEDPGNPDKINEIRNKVASAEAPVITDPDVQTELLEIIKQRSEAFEKEIRLFVPDKNRVEAAAQRFKDELMNNVRQHLTNKIPAH
jgi:hypothetical protein